MNLFLKCLQMIAVFPAVSVSLFPLLQFKDGFVGYGFTSFSLGVTSLFLFYRSIQKRKNFG